MIIVKYHHCLIQMFSWFGKNLNKPITKNYHYHTTPVLIGNHVLDKSKILNVIVRPSYMWIKHPYIIDIIYDKPSTTMYLTLTNGGTVPIEQTIPYTRYFIKYENKNDVIADVKIFADCLHLNVKLID